MNEKEYIQKAQFDKNEFKNGAKSENEEMALELDVEELRQAVMSVQHEMPPMSDKNYSPDKKTIVATRKNKGGDILAVKFDDSSVALLGEAIKMAENGEINNVSTGTNRIGDKTLRTNRDEFEENNLSQLPEF